MNKRPWWISAALAWVGVVAVVALVTWWVIDSAGEEILAEPAADPLTPTMTATTTTTATDPTDEPTRSRQPTQRPTGGATTPVPPPTTPPATTAPQTSAPPSAPEDPTTEEAPVERSSSWQGAAGTVRVSCTGSSLRLDGATPADGYEVDTSTRHSGSELEVRFRSVDGDRETEVLARCVGGAPDFRVEND